MTRIYNCKDCDLKVEFDYVKKNYSIEIKQGLDETIIVLPEQKFIALKNMTNFSQGEKI